MPTVQFQGQTIECEEGATLRDVLLEADANPHNGTAKYLHCRGRGVCGTCAVEIRNGDAGPKSDSESKRLSRAPFDDDTPLRLACQISVTDDLTVVKHDGFWGQKF